MFAKPLRLETNFWDKISPFVIPTVLILLYAFLTNKNDYMKAIRTAIASGGDVDTTGAITGAISGTYLGIGSIPELYSFKIHDRGEWTYQNSMDLAEQMCEQLNGE